MSLELTLTNLQNVAPGNTATLKCPVGPGAPTYDQIQFELSGGLVPADITFIRGKANGRIFLDESSGTDINKRDDYRGIFTEAGYVTLDFTEPKARNGAAEQLVSAVPGSLLQDLSFELGIGAGANPAGKIVAKAIYRPPTSNPYIRKILNTTQAFSAAGTDGAPNIVYIPNGDAGGKIKRIWIKESVDQNITAAQIRIANNVIFEATRAQIKNQQKRNGLVPQANWCVLDFVADGNLAGLLDAGKAPTIEVRLTTGAAGSYTLYYELIDPIGRL